MWLYLVFYTIFTLRLQISFFLFLFSCFKHFACVLGSQGDNFRLHIKNKKKEIKWNKNKIKLDVSTIMLKTRQTKDAEKQSIAISFSRWKQVKLTCKSILTNIQFGWAKLHAYTCLNRKKKHLYWMLAKSFVKQNEIGIKMLQSTTDFSVYLS